MSRFERSIGVAFVSLLTLAPFAATAQAGSVSGPLYAHDVVLGNHTIWYTVTVSGGERVNIEMQSDNASDLDLFVLDMAGNVIQSDLRYTNAAAIWLEPSQTITIQIAVRNNGRSASEFELRID